MKNYLTLSLILILTFQCYSQGLGVNSELPVSINTDGSSPNSSAILDVKSTNKGVLIPRMTSSQRNSISSPATGLLVFDSNTKGFWFYNGSAWTDLSSSSTLSELPTNPQFGEMTYYNGSDWVSVLPGTTGQKLCYCEGVPTWGTCPPTCSDGIKNQNEIGVDCGGFCPPCSNSCDCPPDGNVAFETGALIDPCTAVTIRVFGIDGCLGFINWAYDTTCCGGSTGSTTSTATAFLLGSFDDTNPNNPNNGDISVSVKVTLANGTVCPTITKRHTPNCNP